MRQDCPLPPGSLMWIYCRHSPGDEQDIGSQVRAAETYCQRHGLVVAHTFQDIARTGSTTAGRGEFLAMMRASRQEPRLVDGIVFWSFSRLSRDYDDSQFYKADLRRRGYMLISLTEPIPEGLEGRLVEAAYDFASALYLDQMTEAIKRELHDLARKGFAVGGSPPKGYLAEKTQIGYKSSGAPKFGTRWVPDPNLFPLAQRAWEMRVDGATYYEIHHAIPFYKQPRCWADFFANKTYLGIRKCGTIEVPDAHPAACTQEQWDRVATMRRRSRGGAYPRQVRSPFLLSGLLECAYCHGSVSGSSTGDGWRYYVCARKPNYGWSTCEAKSIKAAKLDQAVVATVLEHVLTPPRFYELVEQVNQELATDQNGLDLEVQRTQREMAETTKRVSNLLYTIAAGSLTATDLLLVEEKQKARLEAELALLERRKAQQRIVVDDAMVAAKLQQMREDLAGFTSDNVTHVQKFLRSFVARIVVADDGGELYYHIPPILSRNQADLPRECCPITSVEFAYA